MLELYSIYSDTIHNYISATSRMMINSKTAPDVFLFPPSTHSRKFHKLMLASCYAVIKVQRVDIVEVKYTA